MTPKTEDEVKKIGVANVRKEYTKLANTYNDILDNKICYCPRCNHWLAASAFYLDRTSADNVQHWGCKKCILQAGTDYDKKNDTYQDNKDKAKYICQILDLPFLESTYDKQVQAAIDGINEKNRSTGFQSYMVMIASLPNYKGMTYADSQWNDVDDAYSNNSNRKPRKEIIKMFGSSYNNDDYLYLQDQYDEWKIRTQVDSKSQETYVIQICCQLLDIRKARQQGKDVSKLTDALSKLMGDANLQPKQNVGNAATDSLTFGQLIEKWELEKPIPEPDEDFKDVNNIGKLLRVFFSGHLAKSLGLKNAYSKEYEEEIAKYTVTKPEYSEEGGSSEIYDYLFGAEEVE